LDVDVRTALANPPSVRDPQYGEPEVCVAILDGPVDLAHPCFVGADLARLNTLVADPVGAGPHRFTVRMSQA
jgi:hypothetical protein